MKLAKFADLLTKQAPGGNLTLVALGDGAFTISNLGSISVDQFTVIINAPQAAILAERNITLPLFRFLLTIIINV